MNEYLLQFELRSDTKGYEKTDLKEWREVIEQSIEHFNDNGSEFSDERHLDLKTINEKDFYVQLQTRLYWDDENRSFYNRAGALSRYLKVHGMKKLSSPHGKMFTINVINKHIDPKIQKIKDLKQETIELKQKTIELKQKIFKKMGEKIYVDHKNKSILIPKEWMDYYCIKFYGVQKKESTES